MTIRRTSADTGLMICIILLTVGTAAIHLYLGSLGFPMFVLNGLGYLGLLAALYLPVPQLARHRRTARWALTGYTALTVFLWIVIGERTTLGYTDKVIEVALIALLLIEIGRSR